MVDPDPRWELGDDLRSHALSTRASGFERTLGSEKSHISSIGADENIRHVDIWLGQLETVSAVI